VHAGARDGVDRGGGGGGGLVRAAGTWAGPVREESGPGGKMKGNGLNPMNSANFDLIQIFKLNRIDSIKRWPY
jgi:hypothetical protein